MAPPLFNWEAIMFFVQRANLQQNIILTNKRTKYQ